MNRQMMIFGLVSAVALTMTPFANKNKKNKLITVVTCAVIMTFFLGFRTWWMADNIKYHTQFGNVGSLSLIEMLEEDVFNIGLRYYFHIVYTYFGKNFQIALIGIAAFEMYCLGYLINRHSASVFWSYFSFVFLGFYFFLFSGLKQGIAMGFLLLAYTGILERKPIKFIIFTILGGVFHAPALIFIIAYPWANLKFGRHYFVFLLLIVFSVLLFRTQIVTFLGNMYYEEAEFVSSKGISGKFIAMLAIIFFSAVLRPAAIEDDVYYKTFNLMVLAALLQSFSVFGNNFTRLSDYYFQFSVIFIPLVMQYRPEEDIPDNAFPLIRFTKQSYVVGGILLCIFGTLFYSNYVSTDVSGITNMKFFWEVVETPWGS